MDELLVDYEKLAVERDAISEIMNSAWLRGVEEDAATSRALAMFVGSTMRKAGGKAMNNADVRHAVYGALVKASAPVTAYGMGYYACKALIEWVYGVDQVGKYTPRILPSMVLQWMAASV